MAITKWELRALEDEATDAAAIAETYEEDGDERAPVARALADQLAARLVALKDKHATQRAKARRYSRARSAAMSDLGLRRCRNGGWE